MSCRNLSAMGQLAGKGGSTLHGDNMIGYVNMAPKSEDDALITLFGKPRKMKRSAWPYRRVAGLFCGISSGRDKLMSQSRNATGGRRSAY